jgi:hypothetical protein
VTDTTSTADAAVLQRRGFLRGGALLAAAAGGAVAASAGSALPARADDSEFLAASLGIPPERLVDTRTAEGRELIVASSSSAFDSKHRLKKYAWIDIAVFPADEDITLLSAFVNVGSRGSTKKGTLGVTQAGEPRPEAWTLHYAKGAEINNSAIVGVTVDDDNGVYVVRVYAGSVTHVVLDLTGVSALLPLGSGSEARTTARTSGRASAARVVQAVKSLRR